MEFSTTDVPIGSAGRTLACDAVGRGPETVLLVMGLGVQRLSWHASFCTALAETGLRVIRVDNRDVGGSSRFDDLGTPSLARLAAGFTVRRGLTPPYTLADMADDLVAVLDHHGVRAAHLVGVSMGGMIAQTFAVRHPARTRTLTSLMSTTGYPPVARPSPRGLAILLRRPPGEGLDAFRAHLQRTAKDLCNGAEGFDAAYIDEIAEAAYPGRPSAAGVKRHLAASIGGGDRTSQCAAIRAPTLVIHGRRDPLFPVAAAEQLAATVPGARLELLDDLGHAFMPSHWPRLASSIAKHVGSA